MDRRTFFTLKCFCANVDVMKQIMDYLGLPAKTSQVENALFTRSAGVSWESTEAFLELTVPFSLELKLNILFFSTCSRLLCSIIPLQRWDALFFVSVFLSGGQQWKRGEALSSHGLHLLMHGRMPWCCTEAHYVCGQLSCLGMSKTGLWESQLSWVSMAHMVVLLGSPWSHHFLWFCQHPLNFLMKGTFYFRACGGSRCCEDGKFDEM